MFVSWRNARALELAQCARMFIEIEIEIDIAIAIIN
jgi:hypothetical protein